MHRLALTLLLLAATALPTAAQQVALTMRDGLVTMDARNATVRQILSEWAKVGRVAVVNGEKVTGPPVTLQLAGLPERQALDIILRGVAGYMVVARTGGAPLEASLARFDRVLILAASAVPAAPPVAGRPAQAGRPVPVPQADADGDSDDGGNDDVHPANPVFQLGQGPGPRLLRAPVNSGANFPPMELPQGGVPQYRVPVGGYPPSMVAPTGVPGRPVPPGTQTAPPNPFGVSVGTGAPGVVVPIPHQPLSPTNSGEGPPTSSGGTPSTR